MSGNRYEDNINSILNNQKFLMDNINNVYKSDSLRELYDIANNNESTNIKKYIFKKDDLYTQKNFNLIKLLEKENEVLSANSNLIDKSNNIYIDEFNENIMKINKLDDVISTKNKIIQINDYEYNNKDKIIYIMKTIILYLVLMIIPIIFLSLGYVSKLYGFLFIITCAIITIITKVIQMHIIKDKNIMNIVNKTKETARDFTNIFSKDTVKNCPKKCNNNNNNSDNENSPQSKLPSYNKNSGNEVWLDNSNNNWEEGDIPTTGGTKQGYLALGEEAEPMPYYNGSADSKQYKCKWKYDPSKMTNMDKGTTFTTTIPCEFYPGYERINN